MLTPVPAKTEITAHILVQRHSENKYWFHEARFPGEKPALRKHFQGTRTLNLLLHPANKLVTGQEQVFSKIS